ncbi:hypothetical protein NVV94_03580 [Pseudomonas sp. LS1212]|uniref:hypothetical protein n=1 Tax=Pseudomonas sp. LS1212 TaxID=2972478 RepID=UPI00215CC2D5|nr:hypothetical protein [Pseudomonas sp. LS1212]UVJ44693.1 hypothetical protein NVV94_03580 [Pseudomonas sp. LS1212]
MRKGATQSKPHEFRAACGRIAARTEMSVKVKESQANERRQLRRTPYLAIGLSIHVGQRACPEVYPYAPMPLKG